MRQLAGVVTSLGLILAAYLALTPLAVEVPHGDGRCGPPAVRYAAQEGDDDPNAQAVIDRCEDAAAERLVLAGISAGVGVVGFLVLRLVARRHEVVERRRRIVRQQRAAEDARRAEEEARQAAVLQARFEAAVDRDAALRG